MRMRNFVLGAAILAMVGTTAMGAVMITDIPGAVPTGTANGYLIGGVSADGAYVGVSRNREHNPGVFYDGPELYDVATGMFTKLALKSGNSGPHGVATWGGGAPVTAVEEVSNAGTLSARQGLSGGYLTAGTQLGVPGGANTVSLDASGDGWIVGGESGTNNLSAWQVTGGVVNTTAVYNAQPYPGRNILKAASYTGMAVGNWKDANGDRAQLRDLAGGTGRALSFAAISSSNKSQTNGISDNGEWAGGYVFVDDANSLNGWRLDIADDFPASDGTYTRLYPIGYDPNVGQQSNAFDMADDGTTVGFSYDPSTSYQATIWLAGESQGTLLADYLVSNGVDMSAWGSLERALAISADGLTIAGRGYLAGETTYSAFVAVIPEPATLSFLALGGLALLRRRR